ncbi:MAG: dihydropteroate synthase [Lachnospiraceae bacterium]|nr:dihydropteroate synthase [Lachnospiraceae bacterium]
MKSGSLCLDPARTCVAGILNLTPDSFSDGGVYEKEGPLKIVERMIADGADMIDIGAESTRPGAEKVSAGEEMQRLIPVLEDIRRHFDIYISVDTYKPEVARAALKAGADMINDVSGLGFGGDDMTAAAAECKAPIILMYNKAYHGGPENAGDLIGYINNALFEAAQKAVKAGVPEDMIVIDPGVGFAGGTENDLTILRELEDICSWGCPVMLGCSRKSVIGNTLKLPVDQREEATIVTSIIGAQAGCSIVRVHDVRANRRALDMMSFIQNTAS